MERREGGEAASGLEQQRHWAAERYRKAGFPAYADLVEKGQADLCSQMKLARSKS
jgi:hypothetical protein